jgi:glycerophosphoryl diester phosphodiesterase
VKSKFGANKSEDELMPGRSLPIVIAIVACSAALLLGNSSGLVTPPNSTSGLLAHKALGQSYNLEGVGNDDCTATRMLPPRHTFLENSIPSIAEAFKLGAERVEIDIHPTTDGQFAVFHDWTLDCRTNGTGRTRDHTIAELKKLDVGYGYTADKGATFPFRGKGEGLMPTSAEVLTAFPDRNFLINMKSNDANEGKQLAEYLNTIPEAQRARLAVFGGAQPIATLQAALPTLRVASRSSVKTCVISYVAMGWSGYVPAACRHSFIGMPVNIGRWLWGWPNRFQARLEAHDSLVYAMAPISGGFSRGIDNAVSLATLPEGYRGGISTDAIDIIAPLVKR